MPEETVSVLFTPGETVIVPPEAAGNVTVPEAKLGSKAPICGADFFLPDSVLLMRDGPTETTRSTGFEASRRNGGLSSRSRLSRRLSNSVVLAGFASVVAVKLL